FCPRSSSFSRASLSCIISVLSPARLLENLPAAESTQSTVVRALFFQAAQFPCPSLLRPQCGTRETAFRRTQKKTPLPRQFELSRSHSRLHLYLAQQPRYPVSLHPPAVTLRPPNWGRGRDQVLAPRHRPRLPLHPLCR